MLIAREAVKRFLDRDLDSFVWMKKLTREQITRELNGLRVRPHFKVEPWLHQLVCFYIGLLYPRFLFLLDMGAGKSLILEMIAHQLLRERKLRRALITVPRLTNIDSWKDDLAKNSNLEPCLVNVSEIEAKRERLFMPNGDITVIDIPGLMLAICDKDKRKGKLVRNDKRVKQLCRTYNFLGIDEIHKLSSHESLWYSVMNQISQRMDNVYGTTGTPFGKRVEDLWTQFHLVDRGETFGDTLGPFRGAFFDTKPHPFKGDVFVFNKDMSERLHEMVQHRSLRYEEHELHDLPKQTERPQHLEMAEEQREHFMRVLEDMLNAHESREMEAHWLRMRQIVSGYLAWKDDFGDHLLYFKENPKLMRLEALLDEMGDSKAIICYDYTPTGRMIFEHVKKMGIGVEWQWGGAKDKAGVRERFLDPKSGKDVLVMQTEAGGTGNDGLQNVARYLIFYESPTDPRSRMQTVKRIKRPGQSRRSYVYDLIMRRSPDQGILDQVREGIDVHNAVINGKRKRGFFLAG